MVKLICYLSIIPQCVVYAFAAAVLQGCIQVSNPPRRQNYSNLFGYICCNYERLYIYVDVVAEVPAGVAKRPAAASALTAIPEEAGLNRIGPAIPVGPW